MHNCSRSALAGGQPPPFSPGVTQADPPSRQVPLGDEDAEARVLAWLTHTEGTGPRVLCSPVQAVRVNVTATTQNSKLWLMWHTRC